VKRGCQVVECTLSRSSHSSSPRKGEVCATASGSLVSAEVHSTRQRAPRVAANWRQS
jgi:hypothetical protein